MEINNEKKSQMKNMNFESLSEEEIVKNLNEKFEGKIFENKSSEKKNWSADETIAYFSRNGVISSSDFFNELTKIIVDEE